MSDSLSSEMYLPDIITAEGRTGILRLDELAMPESYSIDDVWQGVATNSQAREVLLPPDGLVFVGMNDASLVKVPRGEQAQIYTIGLAGCTGIAGLAQTTEGHLAGIAHYDAMVDTFQRDGYHSLSANFLYRFVNMARSNGAENIELQIAYGELNQSAPENGLTGGPYKDWHFLDQLKKAPQNLGHDITWTFLPYSSCGNTFAVTIDSTSNETRIEFGEGSEPAAEALS